MKNTNWNDPNFQGFGRQPRPKKERKAVGTPLGRTLLNIAVTLVFAAVYFYIVLPPISLKSEDFYVFVLLVCAVYGGCAILTSGFQGTGAKGYFTFLKSSAPCHSLRPRADRHGAGGRGDRLAAVPCRGLPRPADRYRRRLCRRSGGDQL